MIDNGLHVDMVLMAGYAYRTVPHWTGGFGDSFKNRRKSYASIRSYGFFHASRFMVGALGGRSRPAGFCSPVRQPDALTARGLATSDGDLLTVIGEQTMNSTITISAVSIRQDNQGRFSLNDLHKASIVDGQNARTKEPLKFLASPQTIELVAEYETQNLGIKAIEKIKGRGKAQGTYAVKELVYAYAMWISPKFHLQVIRAYDALHHAPICYVPDDQGVSLYFPKLSRPQQHRRWLVTQAQDEMVLMWSVGDDKDLVSELEMVHRVVNDGVLLATLIEVVKPSDVPVVFNLISQRLLILLEAAG